VESAISVKVPRTVRLLIETSLICAKLSGAGPLPPSVLLKLAVLDLTPIVGNRPSAEA